MQRIKITDLPKSSKISKKELKTIYGGPNRRPHDHIGLFDYSIETDISDLNILDTK